VKASGAALGKGVVVCDGLEDALDAIDMMMVARELGRAGDEVVVEERLFGREFSLLTVVSDTRFASLPVAQDYKRAFDGDQGPNTGGMGAYSPVAWVTPDLVQETEARVVRPLLDLLASQGISFRGCLFSGLMGDASGVQCLEYNVRFGDPECQTVLRRVGSGLGDALLGASQGLPFELPQALPHSSVTLSIASGGYPGPYGKGKEIRLGPLPEGVELFHAGTAWSDGRLVTAGGRVLSLTAVGSDGPAARELAYTGLKSVSFEGMHVRSDIG
jgi:phosphoribosylamine--glycine ligase